MIYKSFRVWPRDIWAVAALLIIVAMFFWPTIIRGKLPVPSDTLVGLYHPWRDFYNSDYPRGIPFKNFLVTDPVRQQIPWRKIAIDQWKQGKIPLWNPYTFSGTPILANIQAASLYPLNILFLVFPFIDAWTILIMLQPLLAGLFMYWYLRSLTIRPIASLLGAIAWSFSGFNIAWLTWGTIVHVALWLPLILLAIDKLVLMSFPRKRESSINSSMNGSPIRSGMTDTNQFPAMLLWVSVFTASLIFQFFAGHAQISLYVLILSTTYALWQIRQIKANRTKLISWLFVGFFLFVVITSVQWVPLFRATIDSSRLLETASPTLPGWFLPWQHLVQYLVPDFFGNPATMNYTGVWNYGEFIGYIGVVGLVFVGFALLQWQRLELRFWIAILAIALAFLLPTPIARLPYILHIPILSALQPTRLTMVVDFALAILAAYGFDAWQKTKSKQQSMIVIGFGAVFVLLWLVVIWQTHSRGIVENWLVTKRNLMVPTIVFVVVSAVLVLHSKIRQRNIQSLLMISLISIAAFDLLRFATKFTPFVSASYFFPTTKVLTFLQSQPKPFRIVSLNKEIMASNTSAMYGIEMIEGYDPIVDARYEEFFASLARGKADISPPFGFNRILTTERVDSPLVPLLGVHYVLSLTDRPEKYLVKVFQEGETRVYEDQRALPRVYLTQEAKVINDKQKILDAFYDPAFSPRKTAIVEQPVSVLSVPMTVDDRATIDAYEPSKLTISVQTKVPRLLVISNSWNPSWRASIDGTIVALLRTNYVFQGVVVPAGSHIIRLKI